MEGKKKRIITVVTLSAAVLLIALMAVFALWYRGLERDAAGVSDTAPLASSAEPSSGEASGLPEPVSEPGNSSTADSSAPDLSSEAVPVEHPDGMKSVVVKLLPEKGNRAEYRLSDDEIDAFLRLYNGIEMTFVSKAGEVPTPGDGSMEYMVEIEYPSRTDTLLLPTFRLNRDKYLATGTVHELLDYLEGLSPGIHFDVYYYIPGREDGITGVELFSASQKLEVPEEKLDGLLAALEEASFTPTGETAGQTPSDFTIRISGLYETRIYRYSGQWTMERYSTAALPEGNSGKQICTVKKEEAILEYLKNNFPELMQTVSTPE